MLDEKSCDLCSKEYHPVDSVWSQRNWDIEGRQLCPECSQGVQWVQDGLSVYRVRIKDMQGGDVVMDLLTIDDTWFETAKGDKSVEVTIVAPNLNP